MTFRLLLIFVLLTDEKEFFINFYLQIIERRDFVYGYKYRDEKTVLSLTVNIFMLMWKWTAKTKNYYDFQN